MDGETIRRNTRNEPARVSALEGWTTTKTAGKALGVSPRTVQSYITKGYLVGRTEGEGVKRTWYVSIDSVNNLRARRLAEVDADAIREGSAEQVAEGIAEVLQNLSERLAEAAARAAEYRTRLELTERAESTLREDLDRERAERREVGDELAGERQRREQAERERDELRGQLEALLLQENQDQPETRDAPEGASEAEGRADAPAGRGDRDTGASLAPERRSWWRRFFLGE